MDSDDFSAELKALSIDEHLFRSAYQMISKFEAQKVELYVTQLLMHHESDNNSLELDQRAVSRYAKAIEAAVKLSSTLDESVANIREQISGQ